MDSINQVSYHGYTDFGKLDGAAKNATARHET